jgi:hypothetical protein
MNRADDPFIAISVEAVADDFAALEQRPMAAAVQAVSAEPVATPTVGRLLGFDLQDRPLIGSLAPCAGLVTTGRTTVALRRAMVGSEVVVLFEGGDTNRPIIVGVIEARALQDDADTSAPQRLNVVADGERQVIEAEREIVLRCGDASITLTRAGKVLIKGNYILSRATGYNKIKGAAIDIN